MYYIVSLHSVSNLYNINHNYVGTETQVSQKSKVAELIGKHSKALLKVISWRKV